jgi:heat shock protein 4
MSKFVGFDLGSSKTVIIAEDGDIVLTSTGSISRPTLVTFVGRTRLVGEEAAAQASAESTIKHLNLLIGQDSIDRLEASPLYNHRKTQMTCDSNNRLLAQVQYNDETVDMSITSLLGMFLAKQDANINAVYPNQTPHIAFVLPPNATPATAMTVKQACSIANISLERVSTVSKAECLRVAYTRKIHGITATERSALSGKKVVIIEMGHTQTTAVLLDTNSVDPKVTPLFSPGGPTLVNSVYDAELGALHFDVNIYHQFAAECQTKHGTTVTAGSKRGKRLLAGCERIRKLLSQLPDASTTVENLTDDGDIKFSLKRDDLVRLNASVLEKFRALIQGQLLKGMSAEEIADIAAVEIFGGGARMQVVQAVICDIFRDNKNMNNSKHGLGAKLDDGSVALGAALIASNLAALQSSDGATPVSPEVAASPSNAIFAGPGVFAAQGRGTIPGVVGYPEEELIALIGLEKKMQEQDLSIEKLLRVRNDMEAYILECRRFKQHSKFGTSAYMDVSALDQLIERNENWMYDEPDSSVDAVTSRFAEMRTQVEEKLCPKYFEAVAAEKREAEALLNAEAEKAAAERALNPDEDQDVDNRKLKKAERMRLVMKNKEEGTEVFAGGVYKTAAARYSKALTHCTKFFDLSPEDAEEVRQVKVSLYLNVAMCYLKMDKPDMVLNNCNFALDLDGRNPKALFRRSAAWEAKKDLEKALQDAKAAQAESVVPDKAINLTVTRLTKAIAAAKESEKKMWGKAFGK